MDEQYMQVAIEEAKKSLAMDEVPIGAIIVHQGTIISQAHNLKEHEKNAISHAEILAIQEACKKIGDWRLNDCTMYVTVEPCLMCAGAILQARISRLVYVVPNPKFGYVESIDQILQNSKNNHKVIVEKMENEECLNLLQQFFQKRRKATLNSESKSV